MYGRFAIVSGYGEGAHDRVRTLPFEDDEDRLLTTWHFSTTIDREEVQVPNATASLLINPQHELEYDLFDLPTMDAETRDELWQVILDAGRDHAGVPRRLEWATAPRSREYLNAKEGNLDHSYFAPAYPPYGEEGERLARERNPFSAPRPLPSATPLPATPAVQAAENVLSLASDESADSARVATPTVSTLTQAPRARSAPDGDAPARSLVNEMHDVVSAAAAVAIIGAAGESDGEEL